LADLPPSPKPKVDIRLSRVRRSQQLIPHADEDAHESHQV
jgi:hypothetical protein